LSLPEVGAVVPVDKPVGPTSHDVVGFARRALGIRRVGHTGTLDPFASGLLLLCVGQATRLAEYLTGLDKEYVATARLGETTDTDDREGTVVQRRPGWEDLDPAMIAAALEGFLGEIEQVPPQFSAKKVAGQPMHRRARRGEHVVLQAVPVTIYEAELTEVALPLVSFRLRCSSGTYVRAVARDLGQALGVGAHLTQLRRTSVGRFQVSSAITMELLGDPEAVARVARTPVEALAHLPTWQADAESARRITHGQAIRFDQAEPEGPLVVTSDGTLLAIARVSEGMLKPAKVFV
jgi:tRNA pseudouridine55 synthase